MQCRYASETRMLLEMHQLYALREELMLVEF